MQSALVLKTFAAPRTHARDGRAGKAGRLQRGGQGFDSAKSQKNCRSGSIKIDKIGKYRYER